MERADIDSDSFQQALDLQRKVPGRISSSPVAIKAAFKKMQAQLLKNNPELVGVAYTNNIEDLPKWARDEYNARGYSELPGVGGRLRKGQENFIFINSNEIKDVEDLRGVLMHEAVGHFGMSKTLGNKNYQKLQDRILDTNKHITAAAYDLRNMWNNIPLEPKNRKDAMTFRDSEGNQVTASRAGMRKLVDEWISEAARKWNIPQRRKEMSKPEQGYFKKILRWFKHQFRKLFGVDKVTEDDIAMMLATSYDTVVKGDDTQATHPDTQVDMAVDIAEMQGMPKKGAMVVNEQYRMPQHKNRHLDKWSKRADVLWSKLSDKMHLNGAYGRVAVPEHIRMLQQKPQGKIERQMSVATYVFKELQKLPDADSREIVKMWTDGSTYREAIGRLSRSGRDLLKDPAKLGESMDELRQMFSDAQEFLFAHGYLDEDKGHKKDPTFLHRTYSKYLGEYKGSSKAPSFMHYLKARNKDLDETTQAELGKLESADYMIPGFVATISRDVTLLEMMSDMTDVSDKYDYHWSIDPSFASTRSTDGKGGVTKLSSLQNRIGELEERILEGVGGRVHNLTEQEIAQLGKRLESLRKIYADNRGLLMPAIKNAMVKTTKATDPEEITDEEANQFLADNYIFMDGKKYGRRYGKFTGKYIHRELFDSIVQTQKDFSVESQNRILQAFDEGGLLDKANTWWKRSKTVFNPPYYIRNAFSNFYLIDTGTSTPTHKLLGSLKNEVKDIFTNPNPKWYNLSKEYGLYATTFSATELYQNQDEFTDLIRELKKSESKRDLLPSSLSMMKKWALMTSEALAKFQGAEEGIFKQVAFKDAVQRWEKANGQKVDQLSDAEKDAVYQNAARHANESVFDYDDVPQLVRKGRRSLIPFMTFNYKMLGQIPRAIANHPWKLSKYYVVPYLLANAMIEDEEKEEAMRSMPLWMRDKSGVLILPMKDSNGNMQAIDMTYSYPTSMFFDPFVRLYNTINNDPGMGFSLKDLSTDEFGLFGGPAYQAVAAFLTERDPFTGKELWNDSRPTEDNLAALGSYMWSFVAPPTLTEHGAVGRTIQQFTSPVDKYGRDRETFQQSLLRGVGVSLKPIGETSRMSVANTYKFRENSIKKEMRKELRDPNVANKAAIVKKYHELLRQNREQWRKAVNG